MRRALAILAAGTAWSTAAAECVATGYRTGTPVPTFTVLAARSLEPEWQRYEAEFGEAARLTDWHPKYFAPEPLAKQCLIEIAVRNDPSRTLSTAAEQVVIQKPCDDFVVGKVLRLLVWGYCVENFRGEPPDFYTFLRYQHARTTHKKRY